jgi:4-alpha-glucanotransferase
MRLPRASGILLHPTSLPGRFGIGDLGPQAHAFLDFLVETGQRWWQILPLGPTGYGNSPYQSFSSYAGNPLLISPEVLVDDGWLDVNDYRDYPALPDDRVDFDAVAKAKDQLFRRAFKNFEPSHLGFESFLSDNADWLDDYALYMALKESHGGKAWYDWEPNKLVIRGKRALNQVRKSLADSILYYQFVQYAFSRQWSALRDACHSRQVQLIGDLPIFVATDSADVWSRPDLFQLDKKGRPTVVAGVPPDYFSATGQLWGNPLYRWKAHAKEKFAWWIARMKAQLDRVDLVRLDHFRGFEAYWEVPAGSETAATGRWALGPGTAFLEALRDGLGGLPLIAEDLGEITAEVRALRDRFDLPGMRILQFAFGGGGTEQDLPHRHINHCIVYTGTHDNDTTVGWFTATGADTTMSKEQREAERKYVLRYLGTIGKEIHWDMIRIGMGSVADTMIVPLQDVLGLDSTARMNVPGSAEGNWSWRFQASQLDPRVRHRLADLTAVYSRWNGEVPAEFCPLKAPVAEESVMVRGATGEMTRSEMTNDDRMSKS